MEGTFAIVAIFVGLPWLILHYMTKWKTAPTLTNDDEALLEELFQLSRRLDDRLETVERLVASDNPDFTPRRLPVPEDLPETKLADFDRALSRRTAK